MNISGGKGLGDATLPHSFKNTNKQTKKPMSRKDSDSQVIILLAHPRSLGLFRQAKSLHGDKLQKGHPGILLPQQCWSHLPHTDNEENAAGAAGRVGCCVTVLSGCGTKPTSFE